MRRREESDVERRIRQRLFGPDVATFRTCADGYVVGYSTERFGEDVRKGGAWVSMVWKPTGKGARSGTATEWTLVDRLTGIHRTRRQARERAVRLWREHEARGRETT